MTLAQGILGVLWLAVIAYGVLGGADFGGGVLDLLARGPGSERQRTAISRAMGPVWEANHVWLIFFITGLFSAFPTAFAAISTALFVPATLALVGIVLRGATFAFRSHLQGADLSRSRLGAVFGIASIMTPVFFGAAAGGLARDTIRYHAADTTFDGVLGIWLGPFQLVCGALALAVCAYIAATFLTVETHRANDAALTAIFRNRALWSGSVAGALSLIALALARADTTRLYGRLTSTALPIVILGVLAGTISLAAVMTRHYRMARAAATLAVAAVISGWGLAQYPHLAGPDLTITTAAAPHNVLSVLAIAGGAGMVLLIPSLWLLYGAFRRPPLAVEP